MVVLKRITSLTADELPKKHLNCGSVPVVVSTVCIPKHESGFSFSKTALGCEDIRYAAVSVLSGLAALAMFAHNRHAKCYTVQYSIVQKVKLAK